MRACGFCHLPNGQGRPENAGLAGLPAAYIEQQMADYRNGLRKSSEPRMGPPALMLTIGKASNAEESKVAAEYFASFPFQALDSRRRAVDGAQDTRAGRHARPC